MADVFEHRLGWRIELDGKEVIGEYVGDKCPLTAATRAHAIDRDNPVRIETADGVVMELDFLSFGRFHQEGDPLRADPTGKATPQFHSAYEAEREDKAWAYLESLDR